MSGVGFRVMRSTGLGGFRGSGVWGTGCGPGTSVSPCEGERRRERERKGGREGYHGRDLLGAELALLAADGHQDSRLRVFILHHLWMQWREERVQENRLRVGCQETTGYEWKELGIAVGS